MPDPISGSSEVAWNESIWYLATRKTGNILAKRPVWSDIATMTVATKTASSERTKREIEAMHEAGRRIRASKETARAYMIKHGFITKSGKLPKRYGG